MYVTSSLAWSDRFIFLLHLGEEKKTISHPRPLFFLLIGSGPRDYRIIGKFSRFGHFKVFRE